MQILLIGAGYVGTALLREWSGSDQFVVVTTTPDKISSLDALPCVKRALLPPYDQAFNECDAAIICVAPKKGVNYEETYLKTAQTVQALLQRRTKPLYLLYTSSTSVYGLQDKEWVDEQAPPNPQTPESQILFQSEQTYLECARSPIKVCILRLGGISGPGRELEARARRFSGKEIPGLGDYPTNHSPLNVIVDSIIFSFAHQLEGIYNVVIDDHPTREELYGKLCEKEGLPPPIWNPELTSRHGSRSCISNAKLKSEGFIFPE